METGFIFLGFNTNGTLQIVGFFTLFIFLMFLITRSGHITVLIVSLIDLAFYIPMYFFLCILFFIEICYTLVIVPQMLVNLLVKNRRISLCSMCYTNIFLLCFWGCGIVCNPLCYAFIMSRNVSVQFLATAYASVFTISMGLTMLIFSPPFCGSHNINYFLCNI